MTAGDGLLKSNDWICSDKLISRIRCVGIIRTKWLVVNKFTYLHQFGWPEFDGFQYIFTIVTKFWFTLLDKSPESLGTNSNKNHCNARFHHEERTSPELAIR
jgi:hypothetical protein